MRASFFEYHVAMSGLFTARANLNVISHNIANAAMPGFSRQYAMQKASMPLYFGDGRGMYGTGSEVYNIGQIRDVYLDRKYWHQKAILGEYQAKNTQLSLTEIIFNDLPETAPGEGTGIRTAFTNFMKRLQDLTTATPDATFRTNVILAADTLANLVRSNAEALQKQQRDLHQEIEGIVTRINSLGIQIASLSKQIHQYEYDGSFANDLRDQRALLVDDLSQYVNVTVEELDYSSPESPHDLRFTVMINGYDFVNHTSAHPLVCVPRELPSGVTTTGGYVLPANGIPNEKRNDMDVPGLYDLYFADSGSIFNIYSTTLKGTLKGLVDMRDGNNGVSTPRVDKDNTDATDPYNPNAAVGKDYEYDTTAYKGIPFYLNKLNDLVRTFARAINEGLDRNYGNILLGSGYMTGHIDGNNLYEVRSGVKESQILFFTSVIGKNAATIDDFGWLPVLDENYDPVMDAYGNPLRILKYDDPEKPDSKLTCLNFNVNPDLITDPYLLACASDRNTGESLFDVITGFASLSSYESLFREGKLIDFIIATTDHLAIDKMQSENFEVSYTEITLSTENQRLSVSGVDLNEEMMAMIKYNQLYQACAKLVNVIDKIYDTMINRLGVG
jgi:flagellar hook-associated protein 1 FlgK